MDIVQTIIKIIAAVAILMIVIDIMGWSTGASYAGSASTFVQSIADEVVTFPSKVFCFILKLIGGLIEAGVALVWGILPLGSSSPPSLGLTNLCSL